MRSRISLALAMSCVAALAACDGNGGPVLVPDAGPRDAGPPPVDAFVPEVDTERPRVTATTPEQGARGIGAAAAITISFSEAMGESAGTVTVRADGAAVASVSAWSDDATLTVTPSAALPSEARIEVALDDDFADVAGNTLALPFTLVFETGDFDPPVVASSDPAQGATDLSARLGAITITFDEPMDNSVGTLSLEGGAGTLGAATWLDGRTLRAPVSGLAYGTTYRVALAGFEDSAGNALDASVYLDEGALELTTGADDDAPRLADSVPSEGQVNVALRGTPSIVLVFDEPMDPSAGTATLEAGGLSTALAGGTWSDGNRRLSLPVAGRLYPNAPHAVVLEGFEDVAGNALDTVTYLGDGALDFDTGADATVPIVVFSYPNEGSTGSDHHLARIEIAFDRAMDQTTESVQVHDGTSSFDAAVTWNLAGTRAYADVSSRIRAGRSYAVDLRGFVDLNGDPVDPAAPYLGDGILDFETRAPRGEQCRDELRVSEATGTTAGGGYEWVIAETSMATIDNGRACQYPGADSTNLSPDAVIVYRKTSASGSAGGRYLRVSAETAVANRLTVAVYRNSCGEAGGGGPDARLTCQWDRYRWDQYLDVGEGDYYVWVANTMASTQPRITVRIEEVDAVPAGETCASPLRAVAGEPTYTAPSAPGGAHVWTIAPDTYHGADMSPSWPSDGAIACDAQQAQGADFVIELDKAEDETLIDVLAQLSDAGISDRAHIEALSVCDPRSAGVVSYGAECGLDGGMTTTSGAPRRMTFRAPAGPFYLWGALDLQRSGLFGGTVSIQEIPDAPGVSCDNAITIPASGTTPITPDSIARFEPPSCMRSSALLDGITWYRLTTDQVATVLRTDAAAADGFGAFAVIDAASGRELACNAGAPSIPALALLPVGSDVCIAVRNGTGIGALSVAGHPYGGIRGTPTELPISPPLNTSGNPVSYTTARWLAATPTTLYAGLTSSVVNAPRAGGAATQVTINGAYVGYDGLAVGEALFSLDETASTTGAGLDRLFRIATATGTWAGDAPTIWDGSFVWPADSFRAMTYDGTSIFVANDWAAAVPTAIWRFDATTAGNPTSLGALGASTRGVSALAVDATWFYWLGAAVVDGTPQEGVFRLRRSAVGSGTPERIAVVPVALSSGAAGGLGSIAVDSLDAATYLYARGSDGHVHVVADPGGSAPVHLGAISTIGGNQAMAIDRGGPSLFVIDGSASPGRFVRLD